MSAFMQRVTAAVLVCGFMFGPRAMAQPQDEDRQQETKTPAQQRAEIRKMRDDTLAQLYRHRADARAKIAKAAGYGVFRTGGVQIIFFGGGAGRGIVVDHATKKETFMNMGQVTAGIGLGVRDFRGVFVFNDRRTLQRFVESGWEFGAQADAAAKAGKQGVAASDAASARDAIEIYQVTENGVILSLTVAGTKYWKDRDLNQP